MRIRTVTALIAASTLVAGAAVLIRQASAGPADSGVLQRLSLDQRVGQLLMVGVPATGAGTAALQQVSHYHVGGVILTGRSSAGVAATANLSAQVQAQATTAENAG